MHQHAPDDYRCPFCSISEGYVDARVQSVASDVVYRDDAVTAFISSHQWEGNPGNVIVIPNVHVENLYDLPDDSLAAVHRCVRDVAVAMKEAWRCAGVSTRQHNELAGNQDVWHYHVHVTPRHFGDDFYTRYLTARALMPPEERARYAAQLRQQMASRTRL